MIPTNMDRRLVERFDSRQKFYTILNIVLMLWYFTQMIIYGVQIDKYKSSCGQGTEYLLISI